MPSSLIPIMEMVAAEPHSCINTFNETNGIFTHPKCPWDDLRTSL